MCMQWRIYSWAQWDMCPTNFKFLLNVILNKCVAYLSCSCYMHMNNLVVVATLCSHESIFRAARLLLVV